MTQHRPRQHPRWHVRHLPGSMPVTCRSRAAGQPVLKLLQPVSSRVFVELGQRTVHFRSGSACCAFGSPIVAMVGSNARPLRRHCPRAPSLAMAPLLAWVELPWSWFGWMCCAIVGGGKPLPVLMSSAGGLASAVWLFFLGAVWLWVGCLVFMLGEGVGLPSPCSWFIRLCSCALVGLFGSVVVRFSALAFRSVRGFFFGSVLHFCLILVLDCVFVFLQVSGEGMQVSGEGIQCNAGFCGMKEEAWRDRSFKFNDIINVIFSSPPLVAGMVALFLDSTLHMGETSTRKDRGYHWWDKFRSFKTDPRSEEFYALPFNLTKFFPSV